MVPTDRVVFQRGGRQMALTHNPSGIQQNTLWDLTEFGGFDLRLRSEIITVLAYGEKQCKGNGVKGAHRMLARTVEAGGSMSAVQRTPAYKTGVAGPRILLPRQISIVQSYVVIAFALIVLGKAPSFGQHSECNHEAVAVIFRPFSALRNGDYMVKIRRTIRKEQELDGGLPSAPSIQEPVCSPEFIPLVGPNKMTLHRKILPMFLTVLPLINTFSAFNQFGIKPTKRVYQPWVGRFGRNDDDDDDDISLTLL
ncbi:hypothetical protein DFH09DRAFT_1505497 [Mycena vulgaris]|nr:hypothetical protein DFH09DRAFT_1505497 [Mycena vulgaris]